MPVAVKSPTPSTHRARTSQVRSPRGSSLQVVNTIPVASRPSPGVQVLLALRKISTPITLVAVLGLLPLQHWIISTQQSWGRTYRELEQLRQDERQLISLTEAQKFQVTEKVEAAASGVIPQGPATTIFLEPQPLQPASESTSEPLETSVLPHEPILPPLGY